jgi:uncharacterized cupredoxin-like copper-binding protein
VALAVSTVVALAAISLLVVAAAGRGGHQRYASCTAPNLAGTVVGVSLINMGGPMMDREGSRMGGMMRLSADHATVAAGTVSFLASNGGSVDHELVVLPLPESQIVGTRPSGGDGRIDESASVGEASRTCASDSGNGIAAGTSGWVTLDLAPGRYELVCNLPGHYAAGMYTQLTVT